MSPRHQQSQGILSFYFKIQFRTTYRLRYKEAETQLWNNSSHIYQLLWEPWQQPKSYICTRKTANRKGKSPWTNALVLGLWKFAVFQNHSPSKVWIIHLQLEWRLPNSRGPCWNTSSQWCRNYLGKRYWSTTESRKVISLRRLQTQFRTRGGLSWSLHPDQDQFCSHCNQKHNLVCSQCQNIETVLTRIKEKVEEEDRFDIRTKGAIKVGMGTCHNSYRSMEIPFTSILSARRRPTGCLINELSSETT